MIAITPWILVLVAAHQDPKPQAQEPAQSAPAQAPIGPPPAVPPPAKPESQDKPGTEKTDASKPDAGKADASKSDAMGRTGQDSGAGNPNPDKAGAAGTPPNPDEGPVLEPGWRQVDGVALIINNDITTRKAIQDQFSRLYRDNPVKSQLEAATRMFKLRQDRVARSLAMQAGQDMVENPSIIVDEVNERFEQFVKAKGGIVATTKFLEDKNESTQDLRQDIRETVYVRIWQGWITGEGAGVAKRPQRDRFVRPGELKFTYNQLIQDPGNYGVLGGTAETVTLKRLSLDPDQNGGMDKTNELARDLRRRILEGDDMDVLTTAFGKGDVIKDAPISSLKRSYPKLGRFADTAQVDDVSEPMPLPTKDKTYVQILRLVDKQAGVKPNLASPEVQKKMTRGLQSSLDEERLLRAYQSLFDTSYVWPKEHSQPQPK